MVNKRRNLQKNESRMIRDVIKEKVKTGVKK